MMKATDMILKYCKKGKAEQQQVQKIKEKVKSCPEFNAYKENLIYTSNGSSMDIVSDKAHK